VARPGLGPRNQQLVQHSSDLVVDVLAAVVGMKAKNLDRILRQHRRQQRLQPLLTDLGHGLEDKPMLPENFP
jgi:hypothetical protein